MQFRCPNCQHPIQLINDQVQDSSVTLEYIECPSCHSHFGLTADTETTIIPESGFRIGQFQVRELLGEGAFGSVYRALDLELNREVAIKVPREGRISKESGNLFLREARAIARVRHPNVVSVHEVGQYQDGIYIVSELIDGVTLAEYLKHHRLPIQNVVEMLIKVLGAVQACHDAGLIHRDIKPSNILLDRLNEPHITDFGLARFENGNEITVTQSGRIIGTLAYMSPEQARGDLSKVDHRSDQYSLGVILYEMLTGERPFKTSSSRTLIHSILTETPRSIRGLRNEVSRDLETICLKALEKNPADRFSSVAEMADDLRRFLSNHPIKSRRPSVAVQFWKLCQRNRLVASLTATLIMVVVVAAVLWMQKRSVEALNEDSLVVVSMGLLAEQEIDPQTIRWAFVPLDELRQPEREKVIRVDGVKDVEISVEPGEYLVEVLIESVAVQQVYRLVPEHDFVASSHFGAQKFERLSNGRIGLPAVRVLSKVPDEIDLQLIEGGQFIGGFPPQSGETHPAFPQFEATVADFLLQRNEVTVESYWTIMNQLPALYAQQGLKYEALTDEQKQLPVVGTSYYEAVAFAEQCGCRLVKPAEYEYVATNRGTTEYPWGNNQPEGENWQLRNVNVDSYDKTSVTEIKGLFSNAAEMTDSLLLPNPGGVAPPNSVALIKDGIAVRGGPLTNLEATASWSGSPRRPAGLVSRSLGSDHVGFRLARSVQPEFCNP